MLRTWTHEPRHPCASQDCQAKSVAGVIRVAGAATRDEAASDNPRPDARDLPEACSVSQSNRSNGSGIIYTASAPAGPSIMRLEICSVRAIESQDYTCEDACFTLEFDMDTMQAWMHLKRSCTRKTLPALTSLMLISSRTLRSTSLRSRGSRNWVYVIRLPNFHSARSNMLYETRETMQGEETGITSNLVAEVAIHGPRCHFSPAGSSVCKRVSQNTVFTELLKDPLTE